MSTQTRDIVRRHMAFVHQAIQKLVIDVTEEESLRTVANNPNHIKWLTGHMVYTTVLAGKALGGKISLPEGWEELFRTGAEVTRHQNAFPPMELIRERLVDYQTMIQEFIEHVDDADLVSEVDIAPGWRSPRASAVLFLTAHDFYHAGQIAMIRRELGRERSFG